MTQVFHVAVIGSGPGGLSAAARAAEYDIEQAGASGPTHVLLESFNLPAKTIQRYQKGKHVMDEPGFLDLRSPIEFGAGKREEVLEDWQQGVADKQINVRYGAEVTGVEGSKGNFAIQLANGEVVQAEHVVLAIGTEGNPRRLGIADDDNEFVQYTLDDPEAYSGETIVVFGAGDSAIENALALSVQNRVVIINRKEEFSRAKDGNLNAVLAAINDQGTEFDCYYRATAKELVLPSSDGEIGKVILNTADGEVTIDCHRIIARLGSIPPRKLVEACGVEFPNEKQDAIPELSRHYESNVSGMYIVGSLAGYPLIKQAMNQGYDVIEYIRGNQIQPADHPLLSLQFYLLPFNREVDDILDMFQTRIPMFQQMNAVSFRELVIESNLRIALAGFDFEDAVNDQKKRVKQEIDIAAQKWQKTLQRREKKGQVISAQDRKRKVLPPRMCELIREGDYIFRKGEFSNTFFTIVLGEVHLKNSDGSIKSTIDTGQFFGELSLLSGQPREIDAVAGKDCVLIETPRRIMIKLMNSNDEVRKGVDWIFDVRALQTKLAPSADLASLRSIAANTHISEFKIGDNLYAEGEEGDSLHLIRSGAVSLTRSINGREVLLAQMRPGQLLGEMALMGDPTRRETATASVMVETLEVKREEFLALLNKDPINHVDAIQQATSQNLMAKTALAVQPESGDVVSFFMDHGLGEATNALLIDESLCVGCDNCEKACAETHNGISRLDRKAGPSFNNMHIPTSCRHCDIPHCMKDCPPDAIHRAESGEVFIDHSCIGCGNCASNCPYKVIKMAYDAPPKPNLFSWMFLGKGKGPGEVNNYQPRPEALAKGKKAVKCDACKDLIGGPACVRSCPTGAAIRLGPQQFVDLVAKR